MKALKSFAVLTALMFTGACATQPKEELAMKEQVQGIWGNARANLTLTITGNVLEQKLTSTDVILGTWYFETHLPDQDKRSRAVFTNASSGPPEVGVYAEGNTLFGLSRKADISIATIGNITSSYTKK